MQISLRANAKLNLFLKINGKMDNGYHDMTMINQSISLYDEITISKNSGGISIIDKTTDIPKEKNLMYKTAKIINDEIQNVNVDINIKKHIPMQAGLGGGSSDAAAVIEGLDRLYNFNLNYKQKIDIAKRIGADVPFCTFGGSKYVTGIGDGLKDINADKFLFIIIKPDENMPTNEAFDAFDNGEKTNRKTDFLKKIISREKKVDIDCVKKYFYNDFETVICKKIDIIDEVKKDFYESGADFSMMSGSGTTVYAIYKDDITRQIAYKKLQGKYKNIFLAESVDEGVEQI